MSLSTEIPLQFASTPKAQVDLEPKIDEGLESQTGPSYQDISAVPVPQESGATPITTPTRPFQLHPTEIRMPDRPKQEPSLTPSSTGYPTPPLYEIEPKP